MLIAIGVPDKIAAGGQPRFSLKELGGSFTPSDLMVVTLSKWILSNSEGLFALKIHLICPENTFDLP